MHLPLSVPPRHQHGAVLISALLILVVMTIVGVAALSTTTLGERMTANMQERTLAFFGTEAPVYALMETLRTSDQPLFNAVTNGTQTTNFSQPPNDLFVNLAVTNTTALSYLGCGSAALIPGFSANQQQGGLTINVFRISSNTQRIGSLASAQTLFGGVRIGPLDAGQLLSCTAN